MGFLKQCRADTEAVGFWLKGRVNRLLIKGVIGDETGRRNKNRRTKAGGRRKRNGFLKEITLRGQFSESYKEGPSKKWDVNPESAYLEGSASRMEDMRWENLDED
ncbi:hypothetical protein Tco_0730649 [Tanacetum coccineum]|uniref:Uncharacterized protein n=1 Tax=Tanacetum coccineum TaxID=301880 RepID=A0ABQ4YVV5_9ASTR